ncbi:LuxR C-terminal-related transcriptional regulator [Streptomyces sp. NPDC050315]|uniref:ATP-binding protein n=1 Tax=Streptomyces sp. NPDC050315 TaxID=3155039 RepID=UPI00342FBDE6
MNDVETRGNVCRSLSESAFVGRRQEVAEIRRLLATHRLVTVTGTAGVGKTRLALHTVPRLARTYPDGVHVVQLAGVHDASLVPLAVIEALNVQDTSGRSPLQSLVDRLKDRELLLVLDNCEHLADACARFAETLLDETARLRILATSRHRLGLAGEHVLDIRPLPTPVPGEPLPPKPALEYPSLALFVERAAVALPGFVLTADNQDTVTALCHRLDGLPLAIELAAARLRSLGARQLLDRLDRRYRLLAGDEGALPRHRTLQAAVDWSYELCTPQEKAVWARAAVFAGGFDLDAAEKVCTGPVLTRDEVTEAVAGLVDKSLLVRDGDAVVARYRMLESIRQYGIDKLREEGAGAEEEVRSRVRDLCLSLVEEHDRRWFGPDQPQLARRIHVEMDNIRSVLESCLSRPDEVQAGLRLAGHLWFFWFGCGALVEGRYWLERLLGAAAEPTRARARALWTLALLLLASGDPAGGLARAEESHELALRLGEEAEAAHTYFSRGGAHLLRGEYDRARAVYEEALSRPPVEGELMSLVGFKYVELAFVLTQHGEYDRAIALCEEFRRVCLAQGEQWIHSYLLRVLALAEWSRGDRSSAGVHALGCLRLKRAVGDVLGIAMTLELLAAAGAQGGEGRRAAVLLGASWRVWQDTNSFVPGSASHGSVRSVAEKHARRLLGESLFESAYQEGLRLSSDEAAAYALGERKPPGRSTLDSRLTRRETEVAELIAEGLTNQQIADRLVVALRTAEGHVERIFRKLGLTSRSQVAVWAEGRRATQARAHADANGVPP